jgi:hypothetical protein
MIVEELLRGLATIPIQKRAIINRSVLNEAYEYENLSSFSRGMRIDLNGPFIMLISGTASIAATYQHAKRTSRSLWLEHTLARAS